MLLACGLSLSIGWGIRGNFGHEYGAMIPGALAAIAAVLLSGRVDWQARVAYFGMFGALGWAFGGSISYMWVIAYTHSGHLPSQAYGFACLFVIGFLWGALGGAGTALPACLDRARLAGLFPPMFVVFAAWWLQDMAVARIESEYPAKWRHLSPLYWYDTDWLAALTAVGAVGVFALVRRQLCFGSRLILHLAIGWWAGFLAMVFLVDVCGIEFRMTPPRGDNWAGIVGVVGGAMVFCCRNNLAALVRAATIGGIWGGVGFAGADLLKLVEVHYIPLLLSHLFAESTWQTNWHSVLEQTYGFINGIGIAFVMHDLARRQPPLVDQSAATRGADVLAVAFVLLLIPYVNLVKNVSTWIQHQAVPAQLYGLPSRGWFDGMYVLLAIAVLYLLVRHLRKPLALIPADALGKGQMLYLAFLWTMVIGNLMRAIPPFHEQRLITEGVIHMNAVIGTLLVVLGPRPVTRPGRPQEQLPAALGRLAVIGILVLAGATFACTALTRAIHGDQHVKQAGYLTRFGPDAKTGKPDKSQPHP